MGIFGFAFVTLRFIFALQRTRVKRGRAR